MKKLSITALMIGQMLCGLSAEVIAKDSLIEIKNDDGTEQLNIGGLVRFNQRYEDWQGTSNRGFGKMLFDVARLDIKGKYDDTYLNASYVFQQGGFTSVEKAYVGYNFNKNNNVEAGFVYKPFAIYPYPQNGWTYHLPFFLGYGNNIAPGINYNFKNKDWDLKLGYYPEMLPTNMRFAPESATYSDLANNAFSSQKKYQNEKKNQVNLRVARKLDTTVGKQEFGFSGAVSQLHNNITKDDGSYYAVALHTDNNYNRWNFQSSAIHYKYDAKNPSAVNNDMTLMGANGLSPAYFIASEGTIYSANLAYNLPIENMGLLKSIRFYNDYSYFAKERSDWSDSQMNTTGIRFTAAPFLVWADYTWGKNANILGGAMNSTGLSSTTSPYSDKWLYRININFGFTF